jgi:hypothetical protein
LRDEVAPVPAIHKVTITRRGRRRQASTRHECRQNILSNIRVDFRMPARHTVNQLQLLAAEQPKGSTACAGCRGMVLATSVAVTGPDAGAHAGTPIDDGSFHANRSVIETLSSHRDFLHGAPP